ncbi:SRPBCC family protein [Rhizobium calliandrae]|uniref:SRPBCC family protein n=1 Tax=Rhizobium calliandrae TaxID=1312182 RepID=A0ABT7KAJ1_9HYPH|nr:SRPBCC family protein [Rhizobium calliandrae]MDL2405651.1 SRPBCC family protein [Rhizobium calliandrae]
MSTMTAKIVHISIDRNWKEVYGFAGRPENMPLWASGLASGLEQDGEDWIATGILGTVRVSFTARNEFGVIDHTVTIGSGLKVYNALRVVPNGTGCEVMFTLLKLPGMTDDEFALDAAHVLKDLSTLKSLMER